MTVTTFTLPYAGTPPYFSGTSTSSLVPNIFPVAIDGRPYMVDQRSGKFQRGYEQRVRDSQDNSTAPGEAAINPGGLWRRGQDSWHLGAGQQYADVADSKDYRFFKSKGIDPWTKGQLSLLNSTVLRTESTFTSTNLKLLEVNGYVYVADGQTLKYTTDPFAATPAWTSVTTGAPTATINDIATDGIRVYVAYENNSIYITTPGTSSVAKHFLSSTNVNFTRLGFAKGFMMSYHPDTLVSHIHIVPFTASNSKITTAELRDPNFICAGFAGGQNHIYVAGRSTDTGVVYRLGIKADGTVDVAIVALELPVGEYPTDIYGYLGFIILGTNKGVRYTTSDSNGNLVSGALIPTGGDVQGFTAEDRFVWFGWTNYDGTSGLGRLDLSVFTAANTPAYATDLMYNSTGAVKSVSSINGKRIFSISGVGVIVENAGSLVASGEIETGTWRWGIPDRKFVAKIDTRATPLVGTITPYLKIDDGDYQQLATWLEQNDTEFTVDGSDAKAIEAAFKFTLARSSTTVTAGPTLTRWMARAYVTPFRSQVFVVPVLLHRSVKARNIEYFYDVEEHQSFFDTLISSPRIITLQIGSFTHTVIVEDVAWDSSDASGTTWQFDGTLVVTLRSVEN